MKLLSFLLMPAALAVLVSADLKILPSVKPHVHDTTEGSTAPVTFSCEAPGTTTSEAQLKWYDTKDVEITAQSGNIFVSDETHKLVLRIVSPSESEAGSYTCRGVVDGTPEEGSIGLELYRGINITSPATQYAVQGTDAKIWCRMQRTNVEKDIYWYRGSWIRIRADERYFIDFENTDGEEGPYLQIRNIQLNDSGQYICNIDMLTIGKSKAHFINLVVTVPPTMTQPITFNPVAPNEGDRLVMTCAASGTPPPTYMFRKDNQDLLQERNSDGEYVIESVSRTDEGRYQCEATNKGGSDSSVVELDVKIPPEFVSTNNVTEQENNEVRMKCEATGDPAPMLTWTKKGSESPISVGAENEMYVEEEAGNLEQDAETRVYRRGLYLVIPSLKPKHASEYVCTAASGGVSVEKTFKIDVMYKPNFEDQKITEFWGWVGSKTNLTCIANGNPEPVITWFKDDQDLTAVNGYIITNGNSGRPTQAISYLIPTVTASNVGNVFGTYKCKATNKYGSNEEDLVFRQASAPEQVDIQVQETKATQLTIVITPQNDGGQPITQYRLVYNKLSGEGEEQIRTVNRVADEASTRVELEELDPNTQYSIRVSAINNVGEGQEKTFMERTADFSEPDKVIVVSSPTGADAYRYELRWEVPMTGGADISNYIIEYAEALEVKTDTDPWTPVRVLPEAQTVNVPGQTNTRTTLLNLKKNTFYQVRIKASNRIGSSDETTFVFRTGSGVGASEGASSVQAGVAGMVLVVMVTACLQLLC